MQVGPNPSISVMDPVALKSSPQTPSTSLLSPSDEPATLSTVSAVAIGHSTGTTSVAQATAMPELPVASQTDAASFFMTHQQRAAQSVTLYGGHFVIGLDSTTRLKVAASDVERLVRTGTVAPDTPLLHSLQVFEAADHAGLPNGAVRALLRFYSASSQAASPQQALVETLTHVALAAEVENYVGHRNGLASDMRHLSQYTATASGAPQQVKANQEKLDTALHAFADAFAEARETGDYAAAYDVAQQFFQTSATITDSPYWKQRSEELGTLLAPLSPHRAGPASHLAEALSEIRDKASAANVASSQAYATTHRLSGPIPDGFVDPGREGTVGLDGSASGGIREILVVDRQNDPHLGTLIGQAKALRQVAAAHKDLTPGQQDQLVCRLLVTLVRTQMPAGASAWSDSHVGKTVRLGDVASLGGAACRHQALLFSVLAGEAGLDATLVRGYATTPDRLTPHTWTEVTIGGQPLIADLSGSDRGLVDPATQGNGYADAQQKPMYGASDGAEATPPPRLVRSASMSGKGTAMPGLGGGEEPPPPHGGPPKKAMTSMDLGAAAWRRKMAAKAAAPTQTPDVRLKRKTSEGPPPSAATSIGSRAHSPSDAHKEKMPRTGATAPDPTSPVIHVASSVSSHGVDASVPLTSSGGGGPVVPVPTFSPDLEAAYLEFMAELNKMPLASASVEPSVTVTASSGGGLPFLAAPSPMGGPPPTSASDPMSGPPPTPAVSSMGHPSLVPPPPTGGMPPPSSLAVPLSATGPEPSAASNPVPPSPVDIDAEFAKFMAEIAGPLAASSSAGPTAAVQASQRFQQTHRIVDPPNGFIFAHNMATIHDDGSTSGGVREVLVLDPSRDSEVAEWQALMATRADHVRAQFGRSSPEMLKRYLVNEAMKFTDAVFPPGKSDALVRKKLVESLKGTETKVSALPDAFAVCRHRAFVFALMCQAAGVSDVAIVRGYKGGGGNHAWNDIRIGAKHYIVDLQQDGPKLQEARAVGYKFVNYDRKPHYRADGTPNFR